MKTGIIISDGQVLTREGLKAMLLRQSDVDLISAVSCMDDLMRALAGFIPEIITIDCNDTSNFCIDDIRYLRTNHPTIKILVISSLKSKSDLLRILDLGIHGYILKECDEAEIVHALKTVSHGEKFFCGKVLDSILEQVSQRHIQSNAESDCSAVTLSSRELEIVKLIAAGFTTKDIAAKLHLSFFTVATHRKNIFRKVQVRNSSELILYAINEKLIEPELITARYTLKEG